MRSFFYTILMIAICASILLLTHTYIFISTPTAPDLPVIMDINPGTSAWDISRQLEGKDIISDHVMFMATALITGKASHLQAGTYVFEGLHYPMEIMHILFKGRTLRYRITIPEGANIFDIAEIVSATGLTSKQAFIQAAGDNRTTSFFSIEAPSVEGYLYPDTYFLSPHMTPLEIMAKMIYRLDQAFTTRMQQRSDFLGMSRTQVLTLASIIEKEAVFSKEKPVISSVFHNRLKKKMPLQSDPTAVYGIDNFHRRITPKDLLRDSPYNTYRHTGLPPGPICNPDKDSITAALWPEDTPYLYFVSKGDGTHIFSRSLKEHNRAIRTNRRSRK